MTHQQDQRGVGMQAIILFGTLALAVVLLNGIAINVKQNERAQSGKSTARGYCGQPYEKLPAECSITEVYSCGTHYLLKNNCLGTGEVVLAANGAFQAWCGYTALDGTPVSCQSYWLDSQGNDCRLTNNLCKK
ncbi:MAG: hypothetical protein WCT27_05055 [Patescibacteria group bacterium]|jgi:hypothetical protein